MNCHFFSIILLGNQGKIAKRGLYPEQQIPPLVWLNKVSQLNNKPWQILAPFNIDQLEGETQLLYNTTDYIIRQDITKFPIDFRREIAETWLEHSQENDEGYKERQISNTLVKLKELRKLSIEIAEFRKNYQTQKKLEISVTLSKVLHKLQVGLQLSRLEGGTLPYTTVVRLLKTIKDIDVLKCSSIITKCFPGKINKLYLAV